MEKQLHRSSKEIDNNERAQLRAELQCIQTALNDEKKQADKKRPGRKLGHHMDRPAEIRKRKMDNKRSRRNKFRGAKSAAAANTPQPKKKGRKLTWGGPAAIDGDSVTGISPNPSMITGSTRCCWDSQGRAGKLVNADTSCS